MGCDLIIGKMGGGVFRGPSISLLDLQKWQSFHWKPPVTSINFEGGHPVTPVFLGFSSKRVPSKNDTRGTKLLGRTPTQSLKPGQVFHSNGYYSPANWHIAQKNRPASGNSKNVKCLRFCVKLEGSMCYSASHFPGEHRGALIARHAHGKKGRRGL